MLEQFYKKNYKSLELFKGTGSFGKIFQKFTVNTSLDINPKYKPNLCINILEWDYKKYDRNYFDIIWASPPCNEYSNINNFRNNNIKRTYEKSDRIIKKLIEIIEYFNPKYFFIENPQTGELKYRHLLFYPYTDCTYCKYGSSTKKPTRIWYNKIKDNELILQKCTIKNPCKESFINGLTGRLKHNKCFLPKKEYEKTGFKYSERCKIPKMLIVDILIYIIKSDSV